MNASSSMRCWRKTEVIWTKGSAARETRTTAIDQCQALDPQLLPERPVGNGEGPQQQRRQHAQSHHVGQQLGREEIGHLGRVGLEHIGEHAGIDHDAVLADEIGRGRADQQEGCRQRLERPASHQELEEQRQQRQRDDEHGADEQDLIGIARRHRRVELAPERNIDDRCGEARDSKRPELRADRLTPTHSQLPIPPPRCYRARRSTPPPAAAPEPPP